MIGSGVDVAAPCIFVKSNQTFPACANKIETVRVEYVHGSVLTRVPLPLRKIDGAGEALRPIEESRGKAMVLHSKNNSPVTTLDRIEQVPCLGLERSIN